MQVVPLCGLIALLKLRASFSFSSTHGTSNSNRVQSKWPILHPSVTLSVPLQGQPKSDDVSVNDTPIFGFPRKSVATPLALLLSAQFILFIGVGAVIPSIPLYGKEIGLSAAANGIVISAPAVTLLLASKFGGNFADIARKPAMLLGMAVIAASDIGTASAMSIFPLIVARLGLGFGRCLSEAGERGMLADLAGRVPDQRGSILAAQQVAIALGIAIGAPAGGYVVEQYGPRASFLCVSVAALVALCIYLFLPETMESVIIAEKLDTKPSFIDSIFISSSEDVKEKNDQKSVSVEMGDWNKLLATRRWRALSLCQCGATFGFAAKIASIPIIATSVFGNAAAAGALVSACGLSGLIGGPFGGWLTDQTSARSTAIGSGIFSATTLLFIPVSLNYNFSLLENVSIPVPFVGADLQGQALLFTLLVIGWSLGATAQGPALTALAQESAPRGAEATAMALPRAAGDGTYIVAPFLLGLVADSWSSNPGMECGVAGLASLLGVFILLFTDKKDN